MTYFAGEMETVVAEGFGKTMELSNGVCFFKPHPVSIAENSAFLMDVMDRDRYTALYLDVSKMSQRMKNVSLKHHPQNELLQGLLTQQELSGTEMEVDSQG